ncbi:MAG: divalent-cation tolerance protein CutA [Saprospiraceae bacterium]
MKNKITLFYVPCKNKEEATRLAKICINNKLMACSNIHPIDSIYLWEEKIVQEKECILMLKTLPSLSKKLKKLIQQEHPYEIPAIISYDASVNKEYMAWMKLALEN